MTYILNAIDSKGASIRKLFQWPSDAVSEASIGIAGGWKGAEVRHSSSNWRVTIFPDGDKMRSRFFDV